MSDILAASTPGDNAVTRPYKKHALLSRPLYVYDLPQELLGNLRLRSIDADEPALAQSTGTNASATPANASSGLNSAEEQQTEAGLSRPQAESGLLTCALCPGSGGDGEGFPNRLAQRAHFRSDWHRYNQQISLRSAGTAPAVDQRTFDGLVEGEYPAAGSQEGISGRGTNASMILQSD